MIVWRCLSRCFHTTTTTSNNKSGKKIFAAPENRLSQHLSRSLDPYEIKKTTRSKKRKEEKKKVEIEMWRDMKKLRHK